MYQTIWLSLDRWTSVPMALQADLPGLMIWVWIISGIIGLLLILAAVVLQMTLKRNTQAKKDDEKRYQRFFMTGRKPFFIASIDGQWLEVNEATTTLFGYQDRTAFMAEPVQSIFTQPEEYLSFLQLLEENGFAEDLPVDLHTKKGENLHTLLTAAALPNSRDDGVFYHGIIHDITAEKQTKQFLEVSQERLDLALTGTGIGLWDWDITSGELNINEQWLNNLGYQVRDLEPLTIERWNQLIHPEDQELSFQCLAAHFAGDANQYECELRIKNKSGSWRWILSRGNVVDTQSDGTPLRMVGTYLDISELVRINTEIKEYADQLEALHTVTTSISASLSIEEVLDDILDQLSETINFVSASIFLLKEDRLEIATVKNHPNPELVLGHSFPTDNPLFQEIYQRKKPVIIDNAQRDKRFQGWGKTNYVKGWMGIPLLIKGEMIGYITLDSDTVSKFGTPELKLARIFASQAAQAIENAHLYQQVQEYADELENRIDERTEELRRMVDLMTGREIRMAALKQVIETLREQIINAGMEPETQDPLEL